MHNCTTINSNELALRMVERGQFVLMVARHRTSKSLSLALKVFEELLTTRDNWQTNVTVSVR
jgi:hypothetical protein